MRAWRRSSWPSPAAAGYGSTDIAQRWLAALAELAGSADIAQSTDVCALLLLAAAAVTAAAASAASPRLLSPADGQVLYCARDGATPAFAWDAGVVPRAVDGLPDTVIELSAFSDFSAAVFLARDEVPAIIEGYVRAEPLALAPVTYYWHVGRRPTTVSATADGSALSIVWSQVRSFQLRIPARQTSVPASVTGWATIQGLLASAAAASSAEQPSLLRFEGWGSRTLAPPPRVLSRAGDGGFALLAFIRLSSVTDLIVDGGGATITFSDYVQYVDLLNCSRVQIVNFLFDLKPLPYTALAIESVDAEASTATMQLRPGHPAVEALLSSKQLEKSGVAEVMSMASQQQEQQEEEAGSSLAPRTMRGVPEVIYFSNVTRLQPRALAGKLPAADGLRYCMTLKWAGTNPRLPQLHNVDRLSSSDFIVIDPRIDIGFDVMGGEHVTLRNVHVSACAIECFNSEHALSLAILHCGTRLQPGRFLAANNGGHNHHGSAVG